MGTVGLSTTIQPDKGSTTKGTVGPSTTIHLDMYMDLCWFHIHVCTRDICNSFYVEDGVDTYNSFHLNMKLTLGIKKK